LTEESFQAVWRTGAVGTRHRSREAGCTATFKRSWRFAAAPVWGMTLILLFAVAPDHAEESQPSEYRLKAAFLFNFAKFVEWPPEAFADKTSPVVIGVLGQNPFGADLEQTIRGKTINDRPLQVKECQAVTQATNCHILFISTAEKKLSTAEKKRLGEIFDGLRGVPVLTVGETERFTQTGGMINFIMEGNKIRFEINDETAKKAGLKISSKLLSLALRPTP
jgi:hypothetical protein